MRKQEKPKEDPSVLSFRNRQIEDLARVDEEENRRIKQALFPRERAFRRQSAGRSQGSVRSESGRTGRAGFIKSKQFDTR